MDERLLDGTLGALRRRWRRRVLLLGGLAAALLGGIALLALGALGLIPLIPAGARPLLRWIPLLLAAAPAGAALLRSLRPPSPRALALLAEEADPGLEHLASTVLTLPRDHPLSPLLNAWLRRALSAFRPERALPNPSPRQVAASLAALLLGLGSTLPAGGPPAAWEAWGERPDPARTAATEVHALPPGGEDETPAAAIRVRVIPPAYTGLPEREGPLEEEVEALAGSRVELVGDAGGGEPSTVAAPAIRLLRSGGELRSLDASSSPDGGWSAAWVLTPGDRAIELLPTLAASGSREGGGGEGDRLVPLRVLLDGPPEVELLEPERDLVLASGSGTLRVRARAEDPFGLASFQVDWVHTRGGGESFESREGQRSWSRVERTSEGWVGELSLPLEEVGLGAGDVLHLRAVARDRNRITGPGTGVSETRRLRVVREGEEMEVDALLGFPIEPEADPVLTQRMVLLLTEELVRRAPSLTATEIGADAARIAREQARVRARLEDEIYSRATGGMEPVDGALAPVSVPLAREGTGAVAPPSPGSRYGVAAVFDPSAPPPGPDPGHGEHGPPHAPADPEDPGAPHGDHAHAEEDRTLIGAHRVGGAGEMPPGFGRLDEPGHLHDGDPILSVNRPLLSVHDEMWASERLLRVGDPGASIPHQERALAGLQALREERRVFPRGTVRAPPVDVEGVRGSGSLEEVDPAPRSSGGAARATAEDRGVAVEALLRALDALTPAAAGVEARALARELLVDDGLDPALGALAARAADRLERGDGDRGREGLEALRRRLDPRPAAGAGPGPGTPRSVLAAAATRAGEPTPSPSTSAPRPFVFATLRYRSGNWDSAPLVPQNLIHALAQYTELPLAPEGIVVDLESPEIFRFPALYLTGHLPVRFTEGEARNLRAYVERGGFVFMDDHNHDIDGAFHRTATEELSRIFGEDALQPLPDDHELYRTFFHFPDGPPTTAHELSGWGDGLIHPELHAVLVNGRIGILYSNKDYSSEWSYHAVNKRFLAVDNTRFGVNILLYALTR